VRPGIAQRLAHRAEGLLHQGLRDAAEGLGIDPQVDDVAGGEPRGDRRLAVEGEVLLRLARPHLQQAHVPRIERRQLPCSTLQQNTRWSKSSPPSIESPLVAIT
jgi:hypothetical protein